MLGVLELDAIICAYMHICAGVFSIIFSTGSRNPDSFSLVSLSPEKSISSERDSIHRSDSPRHPIRPDMFAIQKGVDVGLLINRGRGILEISG